MRYIQNIIKNKWFTDVQSLVTIDITIPSLKYDHKSIFSSVTRRRVYMYLATPMASYWHYTYVVPNSVYFAWKFLWQCLVYVIHVDIVVNIIDKSAMKLFGGKCDHKRHYHRQFIEKIPPKSLYVTDNVDDRVLFTMTWSTIPNACKNKYSLCPQISNHYERFSFVLNFVKFRWI